MGKTFAEQTIMKKLNGKIGMTRPEMTVIERIVDSAMREAANKAGLL
jgi:hypothetical protein